MNRAILLICLVTLPAAWCYSAGAPKEACGDMVPQHKVKAQTTPAPYNIILSKKSIRSGESIQVSIEGKQPENLIKGFLVQARVGNTPVGKFDVDPTNQYVQTLDCGKGKLNSVTHKKIEGDGVSRVTFNWVAPRGLSESVTFTATIALNGGEFWVGHKSSPVKVN